LICVTLLSLLALPCLLILLNIAFLLSLLSILTLLTVLTLHPLTGNVSALEDLLYGADEAVGSSHTTLAIKVFPTVHQATQVTLLTALHIPCMTCEIYAVFTPHLPLKFYTSNPTNFANPLTKFCECSYPTHPIHPNNHPPPPPPPQVSTSAKGERLLGVCCVDATARTIDVCEFVDNDRFANLASVAYLLTLLGILTLLSLLILLTLLSLITLLILLSLLNPTKPAQSY
jgi:hypothetical protein